MAHDHLAVAARLLKDTSVDEAQGEVRGTYEGIAVGVRMVTRGAGSYSARFTEVSAAADTRGLSLTLRPQTESEERDVEDGLAVDLELGDTPFDQAFIVESAPSDLVERILDDDVRAKLLRVRPAEVLSRSGGIQVDQKDWVEDPGVLTGLIDLAVSLARRIPVAKDEADRAAREGGYRDETAAAKALAADRKLELLNLERTRLAREEARRTKAMVIGALVFLALVASLGLAYCGGMARIERGESVDFSDY